MGFSGRVLFFYLIIFSYFTNCAKNNVQSVSDVKKNDVFDTIDVLWKKARYDEIIEICHNMLKMNNLEYFDEIDILLNLGDAYFVSGMYRKAINVYNVLLSKYDDFNGKDDVLYNLSVSVYKLMPKRSEVDLGYCTKMVNYGKYALMKLKNSDYKVKITAMIEEAELLLEEKAFNDVKFYYDNGIYNSAIICCEDYLKWAKNDNLRQMAVLYKVKSHYMLGKRLINLFKKLRHVEMSSSKLRKLYNKIKGNYLDIKNVGINYPFFKVVDEVEEMRDSFELEFSKIND